ncbi:MAG TPA: 3-deoxy-manno-octulosonate cytidylyltransferase [Candidatus Binataceae bacterium]|nr:3-deoxy-manno-octulosonate cytidylyltransferase [Candidatus Binataceae bacterium]
MARQRSEAIASTSVIAVIPARLASTRLPEKALADIGGVPMVVRVWRQASRAASASRVIVATDHQRIYDAVKQAGGEAIMTSPDHQSGTDRIAEVARGISGEIFLNVQGDLPFIAPADLDALARPMLDDPSLAMGTLATPITDPAEFRNPNVVKVVLGASGNALYFSRSPIPYPRDDRDRVPAAAQRHIGVYAYRRDFLLRFAALPAGVLERIEKLEQLRALENGYTIRVVPSVAPSLEIDTAEELAKARELVGRGAA